MKWTNGNLHADYDLGLEARKQPDWGCLLGSACEVFFADGEFHPVVVTSESFAPLSSDDIGRIGT
jgi:hypothetical protein